MQSFASGVGHVVHLTGKVPGAAPIDGADRQDIAIPPLPLLATDGGHADGVARDDDPRAAPHSQRHFVHRRQVDWLRVGRSAIGRMAVANLISDAEDDVNRSSRIDRHLRLLRMQRRFAAGEVDRPAGRGGLLPSSHQRSKQTSGD